MTKHLPNKTPAVISDEHLRAIGQICTVWSAIEMGMEIAILGLYGIDRGRGLPLTANIGFQSRLALLRILAEQGGIEDKADAAECKKILTRIEKAYPKRNEAAHGLWGPTTVPQVALRLSIRAKGSRLRCVRDKVTAAELEDTAMMLLELHTDFLDLAHRLGIESAE